MSEPIRIAVIGAGSFGQNHLRVISESARARLVAVVDTDPVRARQAGEKFGITAYTDWCALAGQVDAAIVATPTVTHAEIGCGLMRGGVDVLVEKPVAADLEGARRLCEMARESGRILQVGHLEQFNPAILALRGVVRLPLFFEIHRMSEFAPRSLDIDVVLDLMIHDLDIVLSLTGSMPEDVQAAGIRILSQRVDIANVRLAFPGGCIANLTASRVSTEKVRKLRLFQPHTYISVDYSRQDGVMITIDEQRQIGFQPLTGPKREPLAAQLDYFFDCIATRAAPMGNGEQAARTLEVALRILERIEEHGKVVARTMETGSLTSEADGTSKL
jgi:predicted dehydrogenase